jgi:hypothetical protein
VLLLLVVAGWLSAARVARAQTTTTPTADTLVPAAPRRTPLEARGEWLQAGAGSIHRGALPSLALAVSRVQRGGLLQGLEVEGGWLRAARPTTTAQGLTLGVARALAAGPVTLRPGVAVLAGQAIAAPDSGGYDWRGITPPYLGQTGYQDRPRLARGGTVGAGLQLGAEVGLGRGVHATGSVRQWAFSSTLLGPNRSPLLAGVGLGFDRLWRRETHDARAALATHTAAAADSARAAATRGGAK